LQRLRPQGVRAIGAQPQPHLALARIVEPDFAVDGLKATL
jgi:hypothetical protein